MLLKVKLSRIVLSCYSVKNLLVFLLMEIFYEKRFMFKWNSFIFNLSPASKFLQKFRVYLSLLLSHCGLSFFNCTLICFSGIEHYYYK